jgi:hypothetical protein
MMKDSTTATNLAIHLEMTMAIHLEMTMAIHLVNH